MPISAAEIFRFGLDVLSAAISTTAKTIRLQLGDAQSGQVDADSAEQWCPGPGFVSLPAAPTQGKSGCQIIAIAGVDKHKVIGMRDVRANSIYGNAKSGDAMMFETGSLLTQLIIKGANGIAQLRSKGASGKDVVIQVSPVDDSIVLQSKWGRISIDASGITLCSAGGAALVLDQNGKAKMTGQIVQCQANFLAHFTGPSGTMGTCIGPTPAPVPLVTSCLIGPGGVGPACTALPSATVFVSP